MSYTEQARTYILNKFNKAKERGQEYIELRSSDIHKELGFKKRYPIICNAMKQVMTCKDKYISTTESGQSSTITIRYLLEDK